MYFLSKAEIDTFGSMVKKHFFKSSIRKKSFSFILVILFMLMVNTLYAAAPTWPTNKSLTASAIQPTRLTLTWTPASTNTTQYKVLKNGVSIYQGALTNRTYTVEGLTQNTSYTFKIEAGNSNNQWSTSGPSASFKTAVDLFPVWTPNPKLTSEVTENTITLSWPVATDDWGSVNYKVYMDGSLVSTTTALSSTIGGLESGRTYLFKVDAVDSYGQVAYSGPPSVLVSTSHPMNDFAGH